MNNTQMEYAKAKAAHQVAVAAANKEISKLNLNGATDAEWMKIEKIEAKFKVWEAFDDLKKAENAMIAWAHNQVMNDPKTAKRYQSQREMLEALFNNYRRLPHVADKLCGICFRLAA